MNHFIYRQNQLYCEDVPVQKIAAEVGTPFYLYSHATLTRHLKAFRQAFEKIDHLVCFSAKANTNSAILKLFADRGCGLDIVSGGELYRGLRAGFAPERIVYSGVGKRVDEIDDALKAGILMFNLESIDELKLIDRRAGKLNQRARVAIRVNPDVDPKTHPYISTGLKKNKFGINTEAAIEGYRLAAGLKHIDIVGIDCHIGSQITQAAPFEDALKSIKSLMRRIKSETGIDIMYIDMGGGLGITYGDESPPSLEEYAKSFMQSLEGMSVTLILEPGRVLVGNAGILVTRALYNKDGQDKKFIIVDAGMNDLLRPTLYNAFHAIEPVVRGKTSKTVADVVGPICESGDFLAVDRSLTEVDSGDLLAVMSTGAYGFVMSSNYCSRPRIAEVMVKKDRYHVVRQRETYADLVRGESLPPFLDD
ncbi:MAG: diaminopimelate decarboxylase [Deltaproteobacteria bacterium]|jgi:diaminopimelate decarboxylase|nr:diaminopimelate decarboxylase [Deltaproteobacteria bacterium]